MAAEPPAKVDRDIATVWPRGTLELRERSIAFVPTVNEVSIEWLFEDILSVECDADGTVTLLECSRFDTRRIDAGFASTPHAAIPPSKRPVRLATSHSFATAVSALKTPRAWSPNQTLCYGCVKAFDFFRRQHHCRQCGQAFCGDCCSKKHAAIVVSGNAGSSSSLEKTCQPCADAVASAAAVALAEASAAPEEDIVEEGGASLSEAATQFVTAAETALAMGSLSLPASATATTAAATATTTQTEPATAASPSSPSDSSPPSPSSSSNTPPVPEGHAKKKIKKKVLVLINPFSGKKRAPQAWAKVAPLLRGCSRLDVEVIATTHAGHATELLHDMPRDQLPSVLVLCSGDGLVFEAVNGLLSRRDVAQCPSIAHQVSMLHLPGGTSNGLACSVGTEDPASAALAIAKHLAVPWDAVAVNVRHGQWTGYAFSSMAWAVIADVDLGTEDLRWMGNARMDVGAAMRLCAGKKYAGRLSYTCEPISDAVLKADEETAAAAAAASGAVGGDTTANDSGASATTAAAATTADAPMGAADVAQLASGGAAAAPATDNTGVDKAATVAAAAAAAEPAEVTPAGDTSEAAAGTATAADGATSPQPPPQLLGAAALSRLASRTLTPVPSRDYFLWQACQLSVLDPGLLITPAARGWSGNLHMAWVSGADFTRMAAIKTMGLMETGRHLSEPVFKLVEVTGFVLDPDPRAKHMSVDGEAVPNGLMAAAVLPSALRVLVAPQVAAEYRKGL